MLILQQADALLPFAVNLTPGEVRRLINTLGPKTSQFLHTIGLICAEHPGLVPVYVSVPDLLSDIERFEHLDQIEFKLVELLEKVRDTKRASREEAMRASIAIYNNVKSATEANYPGIDAIHRELKSFFPRTGKKSKAEKGEENEG
jgi:hypothetical protein